jgi:hypothetical protein
MDIMLNFINYSNDANNSQIVIFQKNVATNFDELHVAWQVIQNCGQGDNHPFPYPMTMYIGASDSWGNFMPTLEAQNGQMFSVARTNSGDTFSVIGDSASATEVQARNDLSQGAINVSIYKSGKLLAKKTSTAPGQKAVFQFKPTIWIGAVSQVTEGNVMDSAIIDDVNTEISLLGIASADIVMTGGGPGPTSLPFDFKLQNVVRA